MNPSFIKYLKPLSIVTLIAFAFMVLMQLVIIKDVSGITTFWVIPVFYFLIYAAFHYGLLMSADNGQDFVRFYMAATFIKLFILIGIIIAYSIFNKSSSTAFALNFLLTYFFFMGFEVIYLRKSFGTGKK